MLQNTSMVLCHGSGRTQYSSDYESSRKIVTAYSLINKTFTVGKWPENYLSCLARENQPWARGTASQQNTYLPGIREPLDSQHCKRGKQSQPPCSTAQAQNRESGHTDKRSISGEN